MTRKIVSLAFMLAILSFSGVFADGKNKPCKEDREKFCKDVKQGGGRIIKCLKDNEANLSESCKAHLAKMKQTFDEARNACKEDRDKFCKDVKPGQGRILKCLKENETSLSDSCKEFMTRKNAAFESKKGKGKKGKKGKKEEVDDDEDDEIKKDNDDIQ